MLTFEPIELLGLLKSSLASVWDFLLRNINNSKEIYKTNIIDLVQSKFVKILIVVISIEHRSL